MPEPKKVKDLKPGLDNVTVQVRVLETREPKVVQTRRGPRTISEAIVGDETARIKLTLWGEKAGSLEEGQAVRIEGAWTTAYRGQVQLNVGSRGSIEEVSGKEVPEAEDVPEDIPSAPETRRSYGYGQRGRGQRRGGWY